MCAQISDGTQHNYTSSSPDKLSLRKRHYLLPKLMLNFDPTPPSSHTLGDI